MTSVMIVLGNRLNDDGSITKIMEERLQLALKGFKVFAPTKIIVSGGSPNKKADMSEALAMENYLIKSGISPDLIIKEDNSKTTVENAIFSIPMAFAYNPDAIIIVTSIDHYSHDVCKIFHRALGDKEIDLIFYTKNH